MTDHQPWRPDVPHVGLFANFRDAIAEASFRAAITRRRYSVTLDPANMWWNIREVGWPLGGDLDRNRPWLRRRFLR